MIAKVQEESDRANEIGVDRKSRSLKLDGTEIEILTKVEGFREDGTFWEEKQ